MTEEMRFSFKRKESQVADGYRPLRTGHFHPRRLFYCAGAALQQLEAVFHAGATGNWVLSLRTGKSMFYKFLEHQTHLDLASEGGKW